MQYIRQRGVWKLSTWRTALAISGKSPISVMWTDTNKGDTEKPNVRSRLVCKEFRAKFMEAVFAGTPPIEALRVILRVAAAHAEDKGPYGLMCIDVRRAHFYAKAIRRVFVRLPEEDPASENKDACGELLISMYGTQDAAANWEASYTATMKAMGFKQGKASPCHFVKPAGALPTMVHGDDFFVTGTKI